MVEVIVTAQAVPISLPARVIYSSRQSDASWVIGCKFMGKPKSDQIQGLLI